ncbi:MAG: calcium-binding protein, partial [Bauldia litoralis]
QHQVLVGVEVGDPGEGEVGALVCVLAAAELGVEDEGVGGKHADKGTNFTFTRITDFDTDEDLVLLDQAIFTGLSLGPLSESEFARGKKAKDSDDHILYHKKSGGIWYDADGKGGQDAVMFAKVSKGTSLDAGDFLVV